MRIISPLGLMKFQFLMVQLKEQASQVGGNGRIFQFLMVQLKAFVHFFAAGDVIHFNSLWFN